ncbi:hypothetical protein IA69_02940 [Massilia sp. JS1662]|nr:hypothetical protein IA69_02940 [Massilia sp. JS1662]
MGIDAAAQRRLHRGDVTVSVRMDGHHMVRHVDHAEFLGAVAPQEQAELGGVEMVAIVGHGGKLRRRRLLGRPAGAAQVRLDADQIGKRHGAVLALPARGKMGLAIAVGEFERVVIRVVIAAVDPADEQRALLERGVAGAEEIALGHANAE